MKRLVIAIDCDDVLLPSAPAIVAAYNRTFATTVHVDQFYDEDPVLWGVADNEEKYERIREYFRSDEFARDVQPFKEAIDAVRDLAKRHELHMVTGRSQTVDEVTVAMTERHFSGSFTSIEHVGSIRRSDGTYVRRSKGEVCSALNVDILIDDNLTHARSVLDAGIEHVLLYGEYGWNKDEELAGAIRCLSWNDVTRRINEIEHASN